jgi:hypothetical protein
MAKRSRVQKGDYPTGLFNNRTGSGIGYENGAAQAAQLGATTSPAARRLNYDKIAADLAEREKIASALRGFAGSDVMEMGSDGTYRLKEENQKPKRKRSSDHATRDEKMTDEEWNLRIIEALHSLGNTGVMLPPIVNHTSLQWPSGGNWYNPRQEAGLRGIITNARRTINRMRNDIGKSMSKRGSIEKANKVSTNRSIKSSNKYFN